MASTVPDTLASPANSPARASAGQGTTPVNEPVSSQSPSSVHRRENSTTAAAARSSLLTVNTSEPISSSLLPNVPNQISCQPDMAPWIWLCTVVLAFSLICATAAAISSGVGACSAC